MKWVEANDPGAIYIVAVLCLDGVQGFTQDLTKAMELYNSSAKIGYSKAHYKLAGIYYEQ